MFGKIDADEILLLQLIVLGLLAIPICFFIITLQKTLQRCEPESRTTSPGSVWLLFIPLFGLVWQFIIVLRMSESLHNEFLRRNMNEDPEPGKLVGWVMCILNVVSVLPLIGILGGIGSLVCWINYWIHISRYSNQLVQPRVEIA
jgi:ABC-type Fe3+ transport system permease subunit